MGVRNKARNLTCAKKEKCLNAGTCASCGWPAGALPSLHRVDAKRRSPKRAVPGTADLRDRAALAGLHAAWVWSLPFLCLLVFW